MPTDEEIDDALARGEISPQEAAQYMDAPLSKEKAPNMFSFFNKIIKSVGHQLSKVSNLNDGEIISLNSLRSGSNFANIHDLDQVAAYFDAEADSYLALCDSRKGFLIQSAITTRRESTAKAGTMTPAKRRLFGLGAPKEEGQ